MKTILLNIHLRHIAVCIAAMFLAAAAWSGSCMECHEDQRNEFIESRHYQNEVSCVDCHGGDSALDDEESMDEGRGFKGTLERKDIPKLCSGCHSDRNKMKPYGIRTDQYDLYQTSRHGIALKKGDDKVAVCTDCHGVHKVLPKTDPDSKVFAKNIPDTCGSCHADVKLMGEYKIDTHVVDEYRQSIHGNALLEKGDMGAPNCATCHGAHGASPPRVKDVANVCGQCHIYEKKYFKESVHKKAMDHKKIKECVSCHGNHSARHSDLTAYDKMCSKCHPSDSEAFQTGQRIKDVLKQTQNSVDQAKEKLKRAEHLGLDTTSLLNNLDEAHTSIVQSLPVQHTLSLDKIRAVSLNARQTAEKVSAAADEYFKRIHDRKMVLLVFLFFITITIIFVYLKRKALLIRWKAGEDV